MREGGLVKTTLDLGVLAVTLLLMVTMGMELETRDFREVARRKGIIVIALAEVAAVYFVIEVPLLLGLVAVYRRWQVSKPSLIEAIGARV